jgi:uncharacterized protein (DUF2147 family)
MTKATIILFLASFALTANGQDIVGKWKSVDDNTGKPRSIVEITETGGKIYGKVIRLFPQPDEDPDPVCDKCDPSDLRYKKKVIGMEIITGLSKSGKEYAGGEILDPENGKTYRSRIWLEGKDLKVRGYWGPFYRTQTWIKTE